MSQPAGPGLDQVIAETPLLREDMTTAGECYWSCFGASRLAEVPFSAFLVCQPPPRIPATLQRNISSRVRASRWAGRIYVDRTPGTSERIPYIHCSEFERLPVPCSKFRFPFQQSEARCTHLNP